MTARAALARVVAGDMSSKGKSCCQNPSVGNLDVLYANIFLRTLLWDDEAKTSRCHALVPVYSCDAILPPSRRSDADPDAFNVQGPTSRVEGKGVASHPTAISLRAVAPRSRILVARELGRLRRPCPSLAGLSPAATDGAAAHKVPPDMRKHRTHKEICNRSTGLACSWPVAVNGNVGAGLYDPPAGRP